MPQRGISAHQRNQIVSVFPKINLENMDLPFFKGEMPKAEGLDLSQFRPEKEHINI